LIAASFDPDAEDGPPVFIAFFRWFFVAFGFLVFTFNVFVHCLVSFFPAASLGKFSGLFILVFDF